MKDWQKTPDEADHLSENISKIANVLEEIPAAENDPEVEKFIGDLAALYKVNLLGKAAQVPTKCDLLNQTVERITRSHLGKNMENAYVQTAALLIQRTSPERAEKVLDYAFCRLKRSTQLSIGPDCPHAIRADMRDFIAYVETFSASPGAGTTQISM